MASAGAAASARGKDSTGSLNTGVASGVDRCSQAHKNCTNLSGTTAFRPH